ncbi:helix-turn-helix transcriptional regulator [Leeuwenhoekiella aequorea]|uniref:Helix-turn-helix protein n=2 Tax=Flavobacteriia TaxID=117743 RepID=A0A4Q0PD44_9FLAO|nr:helix-turn-helix domain-containing protein [Leeuwenhoekiella aequorea]RXG24306.1 helix-turn-helix protein [Leeuwenhoekiella aequorea]CCF99584.1 excisionase-like protein containing HTH_17 DNA-binding domain [uncultured Flavobacteriia bacterium]
MSNSENVVEILLDIRNQLYLNKKVFNIEDLERYTGLSKSKIYKLSRLQLLPKGSNKNIRQLFFKKEDIDNWLLGEPDTSDDFLEAEFNKKLLLNKKA